MIRTERNLMKGRFNVTVTPSNKEHRKDDFIQHVKLKTCEMSEDNMYGGKKK